jgi:hypothetical protein
VTATTYPSEEAALTAAREASEAAGPGTGYGIRPEEGGYVLVKATAAPAPGGGLTITFPPKEEE